MEKFNKLYLICGKMAAGKSTLALKISKESDAILLSEDELLEKLYPGEVTDVSTYVKFSERVKSAMEKHIVELLLHGTSVVLDFPANTVKQRTWLLKLATQANAPHELNYIDLPDSICKTQLQKRATENPERASTDTVEMYNAINRYFEPPTAEEGLNVRLLDTQVVQRLALSAKD